MTFFSHNDLAHYRMRRKHWVLLPLAVMIAASLLAGFSYPLTEVDGGAPWPPDHCPYAGCWPYPSPQPRPDPSPWPDLCEPWEIICYPPIF